MLFPDPAVDAALRSSSGGLDGQETMVPVNLPVTDAVRVRTAVEPHAFKLSPDGLDR